MNINRMLRRKEVKDHVFMQVCVCVCLFLQKKKKKRQKMQKLRYISELTWNFLKNTNAQVWLFSSNSRCVSDEQPCLKTTGLYEDLFILPSLFHFLNFIFSEPPFHLAIFQFLQLFIFFDVLSQAFFFFF